VELSEAEVASVHYVGFFGSSFGCAEYVCYYVYSASM